MRKAKSLVIVIILLFISTIALFSADLYQREERRGDYAYAVAITPSTMFENEYFVGMLSLGPVDQEWWSISPRSRINDDNKFEFKEKSHHFSVQLFEDYVLVIFEQEEVKMPKVDKIVYDTWPLELPAVFNPAQ